MWSVKTRPKAGFCSSAARSAAEAGLECVFTSRVRSLIGSSILRHPCRSGSPGRPHPSYAPACRRDQPARKQAQAGIGDGGRAYPYDLEGRMRSDEHTSELQSLMSISYAVFCLKHKIHTSHISTTDN